MILPRLPILAGLVLATAAGRPVFPEERPPVPKAALAIASTRTTVGAATPPRRGVSFSRAGDGLFYVTGTVNGVPIHFLIDTGASVVVLTREDAARAGVAADRFGAQVQTASGSAPMAWTRLSRVNVAGIEATEIDAAVPQSGLKVSLLGQNLLSRMGAVTLTRDRIVVHGTETPPGE